MWSKYLAVCALVACAQAYSSGAPASACKDMVPQHPVTAQAAPAPYTLTPSTKVLKGGQPMKIVVAGNSKSNTIGGLLLQARQGDTLVGEFSVPPGDKFAQLLNCSPGSAVTHRKHEAKDEKQTVSYTWTPPKDFVGEVVFRATVAYNGAVFWVGVTSAPVQVIH